MTVIPVLYADRRELWDRIPGLFAGVWPEYNVHGDVMARYWARLFEEFPEFQVILYDADEDDIVAAGRTIPCDWDGTVSGLGSGLDEAIVNGFSSHDAGRVPNTLCALGAEVPLGHQGKRLSKVVLRAMIDMARSAGCGHLIVPVRPILKEKYPLTPIERYVAWTREDGSAFDPWVRVHLELGGKMAATIPRSSRITGSIGEWESWTSMRFPDDGDYVFPGGLTTLHVDHKTDIGCYWEPNVWVTHDVPD